MEAYRFDNSMLLNAHRVPTSGSSNHTLPLKLAAVLVLPRMTNRRLARKSS